MTPHGPELGSKLEQNDQAFTVWDESADPDDDDEELDPSEPGITSWVPMGRMLLGLSPLAPASWLTVMPLAWEMAHRLSPG